MQETRVQSLGWEDPLEKGMATHSSILTWRIPWTEEPGKSQSMGSQRVGHDWGTFTFINTLLASLLSVFVEILFCKAEGAGLLSLITGVVASIWCFDWWDSASVSGWRPEPGSRPLQAVATRAHIYSILLMCQQADCQGLSVLTHGAGVAQGVFLHPSLKLPCLLWPFPLLCSPLLSSGVGVGFQMSLGPGDLSVF